MESSRQQKLNWWDRMMMAITFAEANEADTAREILNDQKQQRPENRVGKQAEKRPELRA